MQNPQGTAPEGTCDQSRLEVLAISNSCAHPCLQVWPLPPLTDQPLTLVVPWPEVLRVAYALANVSSYLTVTGMQQGPRPSPCLASAEALSCIPTPATANETCLLAASGKTQLLRHGVPTLSAGRLRYGMGRDRP